MIDWSPNIELREVNGETRAIRLSDERDIPIPKFPDETERDFVEWLQYLTLDELEAARRYYMDHWNWESGNPKDRWISHVIGLEIQLRLGQISRDRATLELYNR